MKVDVQKEHRWLQKLVGEWTTEAECDAGSGHPTGKTRGSEIVRSLGDAWVLCEGEGEMPGGGTATMLMTLGYDAQRKRFVGTWIGSMMTHLWVYDGELDASGRVLTLSAEGPKMAPGAPPGAKAKYRDVIEVKSDTERTLTSLMQGDDGKWQKIMTATYRRKK